MSGIKLKSKKKKGLSSERGSMMIEAVVGLTLITVGMFGIFSLISNSMKANELVDNQFIGANLAAEGIEVVKNIVDTDVAQGKAFNGSVPPGASYRVDYDSNSLIDMESNPQGCGDDHYLCIDGDGNYNYRIGEQTIFKRTISIVGNGDSDPEEIIIKSKVEWSEGGKTDEVNLEDHLYNWR